MIRVIRTSELSQQRNDAISNVNLQPLFSTLGTVLPKSFNEAFSSRLSLCSRSLNEIYDRVIEIFWGEVFMVSWPLSVANEALLKCNITSIFLKTCVKDHGDSFSQLRLLFRLSCQRFCKHFGLLQQVSEEFRKYFVISKIGIGVISLR